MLETQHICFCSVEPLQKEISYLNDQLNIKNQEILKRNEKIVKLKLKIDRFKSEKSQTGIINAEIDTLRKTMKKNPIFNDFALPNEKIVIFNENSSEIEILKSELKLKNDEILNFQHKSEENEKILREMENSYKAKLIIKEEEYRISVRDILKEIEENNENMKIFKEKMIFLELKLERMRLKKRNLKGLYYEGHRLLEKSYMDNREFLDKEMAKNMKDFDLLKADKKSLKGRILHLEEHLKKAEKENLFLRDELSMGSAQITLFKKKFDEKTKEIDYFQTFAKKSMEKLYEEMMFIIKRVMSEDRNTTNNDQIVYCMQQTPINTHTCCTSMQNTHILPARSEKKGCVMMEEMIRNLELKYSAMSNDLLSLHKNTFTYKGVHVNVDIGFILSSDFVLNPLYKRFIPTLLKGLPRDGDIKIASFLIPEKNEETFMFYDFEPPEKVELFSKEFQRNTKLSNSLKDLTWREDTKKILIVFLTKNAKIMEFLDLNRNFIKIQNVLIISISEERNNLFNHSYTYDDMERLPALILEHIC